MRFGMDYGGTNLKAGLYHEDGTEVDFVETALDQLTGSPDLLSTLISYAKDLISDQPIEKGGLAIKGLVNPNTGGVEDDVGAGALLAGVELRSSFADQLGIPFIVENDARAYAWGEYRFGNGHGSKLMVCMTLGTGLGCAAVVDGKPYQGSNPLGGILGGHISIDRNGPECPCGNRGCAELYCSATALAHRIKEAHAELASLDDPLPPFFEHLQINPQSEWRTTLSHFLDDLAISIVNIIHAYGPDLVVLGGGAMASGHLFIDELTERVHKRAWTVPRNYVKIAPAKLGNRGAVRGAAFHPTLEEIN